MTDTTTLRDVFAIAALTGMLSSEDYGEGQNYYRGPDGEHHAAQRAYALADAMLEVRATVAGDDRATQQGGAS